jgi:AraC family transcriptional regulator, transcriptional activator of pobA
MSGMDVPQKTLYFSCIGLNRWSCPMPVSAASKPHGRPKRPRARGLIEVFALYGERAPVADQEFLHVEEIQTRSTRYDWKINLHTHQGLFQTVFIIGGGAVLDLDGQSHTVTAPCAVAVPAGTVHGFQFIPGTKGYVLTFAESFLYGKEESRECLLWKPMILSLLSSPANPAGPQRFASMLEHLNEEFRGVPAGRAAMMECLVRAVLMLLARERARVAQAAQPGGRELDVFHRFRALLERHFREHWSVQRYASALNLTESKLNRACRAVAAAPVNEVIQARVLLEAKRKLLYLPVPVGTVAYELGFEDPAYFWRFFRKHCGVTPAEFRKAQRALVCAGGGAATSA